LLSFPRVVRFALARSPKLLSQVVRAFVRVVFADLRRRARARGVSGQPGAVVFVQRFGSYANLNVHLHVCFADGVFTKDDDDRIRFGALEPPTDSDVESVARKAVRRVAKLIERHRADAECDDLDDALASAQAAAVHAVPAANSGRGLAAQRAPRSRSAFLDGFSLDADVAIHRNDRSGLERVLRYSDRPALANDRLAVDDQARVTYRLRRPTPLGKRQLTIEPVDFLARLATLIPPPRQTQVRYFGVFSAHHSFRARVVPGTDSQPVADPPAPRPTRLVPQQAASYALQASAWICQRKSCQGSAMRPERSCVIVSRKPGGAADRSRSTKRSQRRSGWRTRSS
jgi:hypothetical protein